MHKLQRLRVTITPSLRGEEAHDIEVQVQTQGSEHSYVAYIINNDFETHFDQAMHHMAQVIKRAVEDFGKPK